MYETLHVLSQTDQPANISEMPNASLNQSEIQ